MFARRLSHYLLVLSLLPLSPIMSAFLDVGAAETTNAEKSAQLTTLLRSAKLVNPSYQLTVAISSDEILITTQKKPKATDDELKIQAVLLSKIAFDSVASGPERVKLMFLDFESDGYSEVLVKRAEVLLYGEGKFSQKDLLASLDVTSSHAVGEASVQHSAVPGPLQTDRTMALERINRMKASGTNVSSFMKLFDAVEETAKKDDKEQVQQQLADLNRRLKDQEELLKGLAQRKQTSLHATATLTLPHSTNAIPAASSGVMPNALAQFFNSQAEERIANYPPDMKQTASRVLFELKYMADHGGGATKGYQQVSVIGLMMESGRVEEARSLLNEVARDTDPAYLRQKARYK